LGLGPPRRVRRRRHILVLGESNPNRPQQGGDFVVACYSPAGRLDPSFTGGVAVVDLSANDWPGELAVDGDGNILVTGTYDDLDATADRWLVARLTPAGQVDPAFGDRGSCWKTTSTPAARAWSWRTRATPSCSAASATPTTWG
jgi:hypothetical protein